MDIAIALSGLTATGDWALTPDGDLAIDSSVRSAALLSLLTDARADEDFVLPRGQTDRRGWWGDSYSGDRIGSRLWQFVRAKKAANTNPPLALRNATRDALQWLIDDGVAAAVIVSARWATPTAIRIDVRIVKPGADAATDDFSFAWDGL